MSLSPAPLSTEPSGPTCLASVLPSDAKLISAVPDSEPIVPLENAKELSLMLRAVALMLVIVTGPSIWFCAVRLTCWKSRLAT